MGFLPHLFEVIFIILYFGFFANLLCLCLIADMGRIKIET